MPRVSIHKVASSTNGYVKGHTVETREGGPVRAGDIVVVKALEEKRVYDQLELISGRLAHISQGDIIAGALGTRRALRGFVGDCPRTVHTGEVLHILNLGGVIGHATSVNRDYGEPLKVKVLGVAVSGEGAPLNIGANAISPAETLNCAVPLIVVSGTCMASGKTRAACEIIARLNRRGFRLGALKLSGVAALRDTLNMQDHGAVRTLSFLDAGHPSTAEFTDLVPMARGLLNEMADSKVDALVIEMGDGIIGGYGVASIFKDQAICDAIIVHVMCANDLVGAWGAKQVASQLGRKVDFMSGPATDNSVGERYITEDLGIPTANARTRGERLADLVAVRAFGRDAKY